MSVCNILSPKILFFSAKLGIMQQRAVFILEVGFGLVGLSLCDFKH